MNEPSTPPVSDKDFRDQLHELLAGRAMRISLFFSDGRHLREIFSVGTSGGEDSQVFDHVGGFYLVGECIPPDLLAPVHALFERYCRAHADVAEADRQNPIHVQHHTAAKHGAQQVSMHYPAVRTRFHSPLE